MNTLKIEELKNPASIKEHINLAETEYDSSSVISPQHFIWKHLSSPQGRSTCLALRNVDGKLVGRMLLQPRNFINSNNQILAGGTITDFVIDSFYRNIADSIRMIRLVKNIPHFPLLLHSSNDASEPLYSQLFKFKKIFDLTAVGTPVFFRNVMHQYIRNNILSRLIDMLFSVFRIFSKIIFQIQLFVMDLNFSKLPVSEEKDQLLNSFRIGSGPHFERSLAWIDWRLKGEALGESGIEWIWQKDKLIGYMAWQKFVKKNITIFAITDLVTSKKFTALEFLAVKLFAINRCMELKMDVVFTLANLNNEFLRGLGGFPFLSVPKAQLPHPSPIYLQADDSFIPSNKRAGIFFTLADLDYF